MTKVWVLVEIPEQKPLKPCHPHGLVNCPFCNIKPKTKPIEV